MGESEYEKLARLIKEEGENIREELGKKIDAGFARVNQELAAIRAELKSIRSDIAGLQASVGQHEGYAKEIDHILERVATIENTSASRTWPTIRSAPEACLVGAKNLLLWQMSHPYAP
jgi:hypothetical protein